MTRQDWLSVAVALLAGLGVVGAAAYTAAAAAARERAARRAERDARALRELAEAALVLRDAVRYPERGTRAQQRRREHAEAVFRYSRVAVCVPRVRDLAAAWDESMRGLSGGGAVGAEDDAWRALLVAIGAALRDLA